MALPFVFRTFYGNRPSHSRKAIPFRDELDLALPNRQRLIRRRTIVPGQPAGRLIVIGSGILDNWNPEKVRFPPQ
jgi:hypothetical protein